MSYFDRSQDIIENKSLLKTFQYFNFNDHANTELLDANGDKRLAKNTSTQLLFYSADKGKTYSAGLDISSYGSGSLKGKILDSGIIAIIGEKRNILYSDDNCATLTPCTVLDKNGDAYLYHEEVNALYPGDYFVTMGGLIKFGDGLFLAANSGSNGAASRNMFHTLDGMTWKVIYTMGQNPALTDTGEAGEGGVGGNLLGDSENPLLVRHFHNANIGSDGCVYVDSGDGGTNQHIMKCSYNSETDAWTITDLLSTENTSDTHYRICGTIELNGDILYANDEGGNIYKSSLADINDKTKHDIILTTSPISVYYFVRKNNVMLCEVQSGDISYISNDYGVTWEEYTSILDGPINAQYYTGGKTFFGRKRSIFSEYLQ